MPSEILVNCGMITISLYSVTKSSTINDTNAPEDEKSYSKSVFLYVMMNEPNVYISQLHGTEKMQVNFPISVLH